MKNRISALILIAGLAGCASKNPVPAELKAPVKKEAKKNISKKDIKKEAPKTEKKPDQPAAKSTSI